MSPQPQYPINIQHLRQTLKLKWLTYYQQNYHWLEKMEVWGSYNGDRRPLSGFILATVAVLEPNLAQILPFIADLNSNPDQVIAALGLDFNPDCHLHLLEPEDSLIDKRIDHIDHVDRMENRDKPSTRNNLVDRKVDGKNDHTNGNGNGHISKTRIVSTPIEPTNQVDQYTQNGNGFHHGNGQNGKFPNHLDPKSRFTPVSLPNFSQQDQTTTVTFKESLPPTSTIVQTNSPVIPHEVNQSSLLSPRNLANWIDDFCQGVDWSEDEAAFIPF